MAPKTGEETLLVFAGEFMAPDAQHTPAGAAEGAVDETVAGLVAGNLLPPEFRVGLGLRGVDRATVPETTVDEDGEFEFGENEIGFAEDRGFATPAGDAVQPENRHQLQLRVLVPGATDAGHDVRAFGLGENVAHGESMLQLAARPRSANA